jgi:hypothetical protein
MPISSISLSRPNGYIGYRKGGWTVYPVLRLNVLEAMIKRRVRLRSRVRISTVPTIGVFWLSQASLGWHRVSRIRTLVSLKTEAADRIFPVRDLELIRARIRLLVYRKFIDLNTSDKRNITFERNT